MAVPPEMSSPVTLLPQPDDLTELRRPGTFGHLLAGRVHHHPGDSVAGRRHREPGVEPLEPAVADLDAGHVGPQQFLRRRSGRHGEPVQPADRAAGPVAADDVPRLDPQVALWPPDPAVRPVPAARVISVSSCARSRVAPSPSARSPRTASVRYWGTFQLPAYSLSRADRSNPKPAKCARGSCAASPSSASNPRSCRSSAVSAASWLARDSVDRAGQALHDDDRYPGPAELTGQQEPDRPRADNDDPCGRPGSGHDAARLPPEPSA